MKNARPSATIDARSIFRVGFTVLVLILLVKYLLENREQFADIFGQLSLGAFIGMFFAQAANDLVYGTGFRSVVRAQKVDVGLIAAWRIFVVSRFLGTFVPHSGLIYRGIALKKEAGLQLKDYVHTAVAFSWYTLVASLALSLLVLVIGGTEFKLLGVDSRWCVSLVLIAAIFIPVAGNNFLQGIGRIHPRARPLVEKVQKASSAILELFTFPRLIGVFSALTVVSFVLTCITIFFAFQSGGQQVGLFGLALVFVAFRVSVVANFTPGNIGILELVMAYVASAQGFSASVGVFAMLAIRSVGFVALVSLTLLLGGAKALRGFDFAQEAPSS